MSTDSRVRVTHVQRRPQAGNFSVEQIFQNVRDHMPAGVSVGVWECPRLSRGLWPRLVNVWQARRHQDGIMHVTGDVNYVALLLRRATTMLTVLDVVLLHRTSGIRRMVFKWIWVTLPVRRAAVVTTISEFVRREVIEQTGCPPEKVHVVHVPIADHFRPAPRPFPSRRPRVLMIGTAWNKNFARQIEALHGLDCVVDFVGRLAPDHEAAFVRSGIAVTQYCDLTDAEMHERYLACDLLMFASTYEGFGMPIVEANAVGRPVVTSTVAAMPEVAGDAACLVDPFDVESIRAGVRRVLEDEEYRDGLIARGFVNARRFTATIAAERYAALYLAMARG